MAGAPTNYFIVPGDRRLFDECEQLFDIDEFCNVIELEECG